jgi:peptidyl-tRNA hydrolase
MKYILIVIRKDLNFKKGPIITQACHAVSALVYEHRSDPRLLDYFSNMQELRKITYKIPSVDQLWQLKNELNLLGIMHYEWIEQPENITTCVAFGPLEMDDRIRGIFDKYQVKLY